MKKYDETRYIEVLTSILHGHKCGFNTCKLLQKAVSYEGDIPNSFWDEETQEVPDILGLSHFTQKRITKMRDELIFCIAQRLENQKETEYGDKISTDHYARYFHALALLNVPKNTEIVPAFGRNLLYNAAYSLWALDDGSDEKWEHINIAMWNISGVLNEDCPSYFSIGKRHKSN